MRPWKIVRSFRGVSAARNCVDFSSDGALVAHYSPGRPLLVSYTRTAAANNKATIDMDSILTILRWSPNSTEHSEPMEIVTGTTEGYLTIFRCYTKGLPKVGKLGP